MIQVCKLSFTIYFVYSIMYLSDTWNILEKYHLDCLSSLESGEPKFSLSYSFKHAVTLL